MGKCLSAGELIHAANQECRLFIASEYDPLSILGKLFPCLGGSASVVVYSPHLQVLMPFVNTVLIVADTNA